MKPAAVPTSGDEKVVADVAKLIADTKQFGSILGPLCAVGKVCYSMWNRTPSFNEAHQRAHRHMINAYAPIGTCPAAWELDGDKRPKVAIPLIEIANAIDAKVSGLSLTPATATEQAKEILTNIAALFKNLADRYRYLGKPGEGGFISMFFGELATWITDDLSKMHGFNKPEHLDALYKRKAYCEAMREFIAPERFTVLAKRPNPAATLDVIITQLEGFITSTEELIHANHFSDYVKHLDDNIISMIGRLFTATYLLIEGEHIYERCVPIVQLLSETQVDRPDIKAIKQKKLTHWVLETLDKLGITTSISRAGKTVTYDMAVSHLEGDCIGDVSLTLDRALHSPKSKWWGHWSSVLGEPERYIQEMLRNIRDIHRNIIKLYFIRQLLTTISNVGHVFGEEWLYGDAIGHASVSSLLLIVEKILKDTNKVFESFWNPYSEVVHPKSLAAELSRTNPGYSAYFAIKNSFTHFQTEYEYAIANLEHIKQHGQGHKARVEKVKKDRMKLICDMVDCLKSLGCTDTDEYRILVDEASAYRTALSSGFAGAGAGTGISRSIASLPKKLDTVEKRKVSTTIEEIKALLTDYAVKHGYQFPLAYVADSIRSSNKFISFANTKHSNAKHLERGKWMYLAFVMLFGEESEKDILFGLLVHIQSLVPSEKAAPEIVTVGKSSKVMRHYIGEIQDKIVTKFPEFMREETFVASFEDTAAGAGTVCGAGSGYGAATDDRDGRSVTETPSYSGLVAELRDLINGHLGTGKDKDKKRNEFLKNGWNELCFLNRPAKLRAYHQRLHPVHVLTEEYAFLEDLEEGRKRGGAGNELMATWTVQAIPQLMKVLLTRDDIDLTSRTKISLMHREGLYDDFIEERLRVTLAHRQRMEKIAAKAMLAPSKSSKLISSDFLEKLSERALQQQSQVVRKKTDEDTQFDQYLAEIFTIYKNSRDDNERTFCKDIARGLMVCGASPLAWMDSQAESSSGRINRTHADGYFLAAEQAQLIISHLEYRASKLGESMLYFGPQLKALLDAFLQFAERLTHRVDSEGALSWKMLKTIFRVERPDGARYERAAVLWSTLRYIYMIFNDHLFNLVTDGSVPTRSAAFSEALENINAAIRLHTSAVEDESKRTRFLKFHNTGTTTVARLKETVADVTSGLTESFAVQRKMHWMAERSLESDKIAADATERAKVSDIKEKTSTRVAEQATHAAEQATHVAEQAKQELKEVASKLLIRNLQRGLNETKLSGFTDEEIMHQFDVAIEDAHEINNNYNQAELRSLALALIRTEPALAYLRIKFRSPVAAPPVVSVADGLSRYGLLAARGTAAAPRATLSLAAPAPH